MLLIANLYLLIIRYVVYNKKKDIKAMAEQIYQVRRDLARKIYENNPNLD